MMTLQVFPAALVAWLILEAALSHASVMVGTRTSHSTPATALRLAQSEEPPQPLRPFPMTGSAGYKTRGLRDEKSELLLQRERLRYELQIVERRLRELHERRLIEMQKLRAVERRLKDLQEPENQR